MGFAVLAVIMMAGMAYTSYASAQAQNEMLAQQMAANARMAAAKNKQIIERKEVVQAQTKEYADVESLKIEKQRAIARGKIRVSQAEGGLSTGGSGSGKSLLNFADSESSFSHEILALNTASALDNISQDAAHGILGNVASYEAQIHQAMLQTQSPFLAGLSGGIQGAATGLSMGASISTIGKA